MNERCLLCGGNPGSDGEELVCLNCEQANLE